MTTSPSARVAVALSIAVLLLAFAPAAIAGKGKPGGGGSGGTSTAGGFTLVLLNSTDGLPHWGQLVTFNLSTSASRPYVGLQCFQGGVLVYSASAGFFPEYPWSRNYSLASYSWSSGDAD